MVGMREVDRENESGVVGLIGFWGFSAPSPHLLPHTCSSPHQQRVMKITSGQEGSTVILSGNGDE